MKVLYNKWENKNSYLDNNYGLCFSLLFAQASNSL